MSIEKMDLKVIELLFERLEAIFPGFKANYKTSASLAVAKKEWLTGLIEGRIDAPEKLKRGLTTCRASACRFPPSIGEFIAWCKPKPQEIGLPSAKEAYLEACGNSYQYGAKKNWTHPLVYHARKEIGAEYLMHTLEKEAFKLFEQVYFALLEEFLEGRVFEAPPLAIEQREDFKLNAKNKATILQMIREAATVPMTEQERIQLYDKLTASS
jgi:hypothetical protein